MAYNDTYNLRQSSDLRNRCTVAVATAAMNVLNEDPQTANHTNRIKWAADALVNAEQAAERMMWGLVGNATIASEGESTADSSIQYVVNGLVETMANIFAGS